MFQISYNFSENSDIAFAIIFQDVPVGKLPEVGNRLRMTLQKILDSEDIDMPKLQSIINKFKLEHLSNLENSPHNVIAMMVIGHMLYGNTKEDVSLILYIYNMVAKVYALSGFLIDKSSIINEIWNKLK